MLGNLVSALQSINYLQALISGLSIGAIYALIAQGYYITYTTTTTMNFAQGDLLMMGAMVGLTLYIGATMFPAFGEQRLTVTVPSLAGSLATQSLPLALLIALPVLLIVMALLGAGVYWLGIRPLRQFTAIGWIMSTVGLAAILRNVALLIWGKSGLRFP